GSDLPVGLLAGRDLAYLGVGKAPSGDYISTACFIRDAVPPGLVSA
ncbi:MAG: hypothetical protein QOJ51_2550, partial [Acidobacteriaceae bacterium]|nr:hypothetical protein [Acidobacteriaceae bacterium]